MNINCYICNNYNLFVYIIIWYNIGGYYNDDNEI